MKPEPGNVRSLAALAVERILASQIPAGQPLEEAAADLDARDARLLRELVLGVLRWKRRLDQVIREVSSRPFEELDAKLLAPLRLGVFQLLFLDRVPAHAAVDQAVREAHRRTHRGGAGFTNAVLRRVAAAPSLDHWPVNERDPLRRLAIETSHPDLLVERWWHHFGERRTRQMLEANNQRKPRQILTFTQHGGREKTAFALSAEGVQTSYSHLAPMGLIVLEGDPVSSAAFRDGTIYLQDVASQVAALVPNPTDGERILDLAAAPGGKSFSLLARVPTVRVVACDSSLARLRILTEHRDRIGLSMEVAVANGLSHPFGRGFDRVVLDLPCTGTGTLRKNPELKWRVRASEIERLADQGSTFLTAAAPLVRPGGLLSVVTCSLEPEENAEVVHRFLATDRSFGLVRLEDRVSPALADSIVGPGHWQILPGDVHDGFTVHVLCRRG